MARPRILCAAAVSAATAWVAPAWALDALTIVDVVVDRPTHHALGVQVLTSGDDDRDARVTARYRKKGESEWRVAPTLFRVLPETVTQHTVPEQHAGSVFDLAPGATYEIEIQATDPDGGGGTRVVEGTTRPYPRREPATPRAVAVTDEASLSSALAAAQAGDVITLANRVYVGSFSMSASGTVDNPIVLRGASAEGAILDGDGCGACNVLEIGGSHVHVERMTLRNATRALRFFGATTGASARHLIIRNVVHGIGSQAGQSDFTICDNDIEGRLVWPWVFAGDAASHWDDRGVDMNGNGHVVCHNRIKGFGDPVVNKTRGARAWDVHGNDIAESFDGTELDESEGNARLYRNRFTNVMAPISIQPSLGGPLYAIGNVILNCGDEPIKLKSLGGVEEPSGVLVHHNTFVSSRMALNLQTPITQHNFAVTNNLFVGPRVLSGARAADWTAQIDRGRFDFNGWFPDGEFFLGVENGQNRLYEDFAAMKAAGVVEMGGRLLAEPLFASGIVGPASSEAVFAAGSVVLAEGSNAIDGAEPIDGINDGWASAGPDLGAVERGCAEPTYGPRDEANDEIVTPIHCRGDAAPLDDAGAGDASVPGDGGGASATPPTGSGAEGGSDDGCGCRAPRADVSAGGAVTVFGLGCALAIVFRRARVRRPSR